MMSGSLRPRPSSTPTVRLRERPAGAGENEVADAGKTGEGFAATAAGNGEARHFRHAARDEGGGGVRAEFQTRYDACGQCDDIP